MAIATTAQLSQITAIYTTLFNRAPDTAGLSFWGNALANGASISTITQGFLSAPEGAAQYPAFLSASDFVTAFYTKVFGRAPDAGGLAFWTAALNNQGGVESASAKAGLVQQIINVVSTPLSAADAANPANATSINDRALFANKVEFGLYNASAFAVSVADATTALNNITANPQSVVDAKANVFATAINGAANVTGTIANDTFNATIAQVVTPATRVIDGAAGNDTLNLDATTAGVLTAGRIVNIETVNINGAATLNTGAFAVDTLLAGATTVGFTGASTATVTGFAGKTLGLVGSVTGLLKADFGATATSAAINLTAASGAGTVGLLGTTLAAASVTGTGSLKLDASTVAALKTVNVTAANGTITLDTTAATGVTLVDASSTGATGAVAATLGATTAYTGGAGVDTVTITAAPTKLLNGGAGSNDVVIINATSDVLAASAANVTGFETLSLGATATGTFGAGAFQHIVLNNAIGGAATFNTIAAGTDLTIGATLGGAVTYTLANAAGTTDSLALKLVSAAATTNTVTAAGIETINITSTDTDTTAHVNALTLTGDVATSIVVTGNAGLNLTATGSTKVTNFDASGVTAGAVTYTSLNATVGTAVSIKGGAGADVLTGSAANDTIVGGAGADTLDGKTGLDVLTGGAGNDTFKINMNANSSIFTTITDFTKGDSIDLTALSTNGVIAPAAAGSFVNAGLAAGTFAQMLNAAAAGNGSVASVATWFQTGGDTYIVVDNSSGATFVDGADQVIKLTGLVDLTKGVIAAEIVTLA